MKIYQLLIGASLLVSEMSMAQTNMIALKSSAGKMDQLHEHEDNFGVHPGMELKNIDSIKYIKREKIVLEYKRSYFNDTTITDTIHYETESNEAIMEHLKAIRLNNWYPAKTKFIDFPKEIEKMNRKEKSASLHLFSMCFILAACRLSRKIKRKDVA